MNFSMKEIGEWHNSQVGRVCFNDLSVKVRNLVDQDLDKNSIFHGPEQIVQKIINSIEGRSNFFLSSEEKSDISSDIEFLPFADNTIDYFILIHTLDTAEDPHSTFREIDRVLKDNGKLLIIFFNKLSFMALLSHILYKNFYWKKNFISTLRLKDWLSLFSYKISVSESINKIPPLYNKLFINKLMFLENSFFKKINFFGNVNLVCAEKETYKYINLRNVRKKDNIILGKFAKPITNN